MTIVHFVLEFNTLDAHLSILTKALTFGTLGKFVSLSVATKLSQIGESFGHLLNFLVISNYPTFTFHETKK